MKQLCIVFLLAVAASVSAQPTISSISPLSGIPGSTVTITGTGFNTTPANDVVYFGATKATVTSASATSLTVTVPIGATYMPVSVDNTATGLTACSDPCFLPTFDNTAYLPDAVNFEAPVTYMTGHIPYGIAITDVDGDGKPDLVVAGAGVSIYRNISVSGSITAGSFAAPVTFASSYRAGSLAISDIDGDGKPDIIFNSGITPTQSISVLRNTSSSGSFLFDSALSFPAGVGGGSAEIVVDDIDGDGKPDIAINNFGDNTISVFKNTSFPGSVGLATNVTFATGTRPWSIAMGDIDGDGKTDLIVPNFGDNTMSIFRNTAATGGIDGSSFSPQVTFATGSSPYGVAIGDIDGDGKTDISIINAGDGNVSVFRNTATSGSVSSGTLAAPVNFATGNVPFALAIGDVNGDGKPDLAIANDTAVSILRNTSAPGSISFGAQAVFAPDIVFFAIAMGDLDGDGKVDIIGTAGTSDSENTMYILRNDPFSATTQVTMNQLSTDVRLQPNPNKGIFTLSGLTGSNNDETIAIEITDMLGQVVYNNTGRATGGVINEQVLLGSNLANGMYLLNVKSENRSKVLHFVMQK